MKKNHFIGFLTLIFSIAHIVPLLGQGAPMLFEKERPKPNIRINNRVLAIVNQKPITVLDLVKEMDLVFYKQYPQYAAVPELRYQFYMVSWKTVLEELVDKELILADAEEVKMEISGAELRQEVEKTFGPNIMMNLDTAGLTLEEAMEMVRKDMILQRMLYVRVQSKAIRDVTPNEIRKAYDRFCLEFEPKNQWRFHVVTIRDPDKRKLDQMMTKLNSALQDRSIELEHVKGEIKKFQESGVFTSVKVSDEIEQDEEDLSPRYLEIMKSMNPGAFSTPQLQAKASTPTYKILYLKDVIYDEVPPFTAMVGQLKGELMNQISVRESQEYKKRLRKQFHVSQVDDFIAGDFTPFSIEVDGKKIHVPLPNR